MTAPRRASVDPVRGKESARLAMLDLASQYMTRDLGLDAHEVTARCDRLVPPHLAAVEFAHTPQLPHAGVVRLLLQSQLLAAREAGTFVYFVNDHMPATALPEARYIPVTNADGLVAKPPRFGPGKKSGKGGMHRTPPPSRHTVDSVLHRIDELLPSAGGTTQLADVLQVASDSTNSHAAWLVRVQTDLLNLRPVIIPTTGLARALPGPADAYFRARVDGRWKVCDRCGYRVQLPVSAERDRCPHCGSPEPATDVPDVVGRQALGNMFGLAWRVCGTVKPYQEIADRTSLEVLGVPAPRRWHITGRTEVRREEQMMERANLVQLVAEGTSVAELQPPEDGSVDWQLTL